MIIRKDLEFDDFDKEIEEQGDLIRKTIKSGFIGAGIGALIGGAGGVYVGESLNDYIEVLKQAPATIKYAVDIGCGLVGAVTVATIGGSVSQYPTLYKIFKRR